LQRQVRWCGNPIVAHTFIKMKLSPLICTIWLVASCPSWAGDQENRFLEIPGKAHTLTFDLDTVQFISPGRFTIMSTEIDNPDVMKFELKTLSTLSSYCSGVRSKELYDCERGLIDFFIIDDEKTPP
jgi:hypothetical protein